MAVGAEDVAAVGFAGGGVVGEAEGAGLLAGVRVRGGVGGLGTHQCSSYIIDSIKSPLYRSEVYRCNLSQLATTHTHPHPGRDNGQNNGVSSDEGEI